MINAFVDEWISRSSANSLLYVNLTNFGVFSSAKLNNSRIVSSLSEVEKDEKFDLVIGDFPFGMRPIEMEYNGEILRIPQNWRDILNSLSHLRGDGEALYLIEPLGFSNSRGQKFEKILNKNGYYVKGFFNTPEKILQPVTSITPVIVAVSKKTPQKLFVAELLNLTQAKQVVELYFSSEDGLDTKTGKYIDLGSFYGFYRLKIEQQIESLETHYKNYSEYTLGQLAVEINSVSTGKEFQEKSNAIYIPRIGKTPVVSKLSDIKLKQQNYFQVVLMEFALNEYVSSFFKSTLGQLILDSLSSQTFIAHLNRRDLDQVLIALPKPEEQKIIVETQETLFRLKSAIDEFDSELALNPGNSSSIQKQLENMLNVVGELTEADRVRSLVREGETELIEFKETLSFDVKRKVKDKIIETSALKEVVAFLNTEGGTLLIGVSDQKTIKGCDYEINEFYKKSVDAFLLHWRNLVKERIGVQYYPYIKPKPINVDGKIILQVVSEKSPLPCFLDGKDFYVRTNPAVDKLEGFRLAEYLQNRFPK